MLQKTSQEQLSAGTATATTTRVLHRDYETRSRVILKSVGAYKYAIDPSTEVLCCAFAVDDEPAQLWTPSNAVPAAFIEATTATDPAWIVAAHNDAFETAIEQYILAPRYDWPVIPIERHRCAMAAALAVGLPARLNTVANALYRVPLIRTRAPIDAIR